MRLIHPFLSRCTSANPCTARQAPETPGANPAARCAGAPASGLAERGTLKSPRAGWLFAVLAGSLLAAACASKPGAATDVAGAAAAPQAQPPGIMAEVKPDFFVPAGVFDAKTGRLAQPIAAEALAPAAAAGAPAPFKREVLVYMGSANRSFLSGAGLDGGFIVRLWDIFLGKYKFPYRAIDKVEDIETAAPSVLVLPSMLVLTGRERQAIVNFRARGGSVVATWLTGVRDEGGAWRGFGFMQSALGAKVEGSTGPTEDIRFLNVYGDTALTHYLPAGQRIWLERPNGWFALHLTGGRPAARVLDWSRAVAEDSADSALVFDETRVAGGPASRAVVFGWPERLWMATDPKLMEAVIHNALTWALRQPSAYVGAWPYPYQSASVVNVFMADVFNDNDLPFAQIVENAGQRATYYILSFEIAKSAATLKKLQDRGHELGYQADVYEGFKDVPADKQAERLAKMRREIAAERVAMAPDAGFYAPMDSYDKTTSALVMGQPFGHQIVFAADTDAQLPYLPPVPPGVTRTGEALVGIPRTQRGAEELMTDHDDEELVRVVKAEMNAAHRAGGLAMLRFPNQTLLPKETQEDLFEAVKAKAARSWLTRSSQVADWARERSRISFDLTGNAAAPVLTVNVAAGAPLKYPATAVLTLPTAGSKLAIASGRPVPVQVIDDLRAALILKDLPAGTHRWELRFEGN